MTSIKRRHLGAVAALSAAAMVLSACGGTESPTSSETGTGSGTAAAVDPVLRVGVNHWVGKTAINHGVEEGIFADHGFTDVQFETLGPAPSVIAALQSNQVDFAVLPTTSYLDALSKGITLTAVAPLTGFPADGTDAEKYDGFDLFVRPDIGVESPRDLEGKTISVGARGDLLEMSISNVIKEDGGDPSKVNWIQMVAAPALEAFKAERIDAGAFALPFAAEAQAAGGEILTRVTWPLLDGAPILMWIGSPNLAKDSARLEAVQRSLVSTNDSLNSDPEGTLAAAATEAGISVEVMKARPEAFYFPTAYTQEDFERLAQKLVDGGFLAEMPDIGSSFTPLPDSQ